MQCCRRVPRLQSSAVSEVPCWCVKFPLQLSCMWVMCWVTGLLLCVGSRVVVRADLVFAITSRFWSLWPEVPTLDRS